MFNAEAQRISLMPTILSNSKPFAKDGALCRSAIIGGHLGLIFVKGSKELALFPNIALYFLQRKSRRPCIFKTFTY